MIDLDAPILPGKAAAGISIGTPVNDLLGRSQSTTKLDGLKYDLGAVKVWSENGVITQVGVSSGYRGALEGGIRIGSTIAEVEDCFGCSVEEDDCDNLVVPGSPGWCFDTEEWSGVHTVQDNRTARIVEIFVFKR